jgi:hypothetical protein
LRVSLKELLLAELTSFINLSLAGPDMAVHRAEEASII